MDFYKLQIYEGSERTPSVHWCTLGIRCSRVLCWQVACYDKDGWNMLYIICDNAGQRNDWIKLIRDGKSV